MKKGTIMNKRLASFAKSLAGKVDTGVLKDLLYKHISDKYPWLKKAIEENSIFISKEQLFTNLQKQLSEKENIIPKALEIRDKTVFVVLNVKKNLLNVNCTASVKLHKIILNNDKQEMHFSAKIEDIKGNDLISKVIMAIALPFTNTFVETQLTSEKNSIKITRTDDKNEYIAALSEVAHIRKGTVKIPMVGKSLFDVIHIGEINTCAEGLAIGVYMEAIAS